MVPIANPVVTLKSFVRTALDMVRARLELASIELAQEQDRIAWLALYAGLALVFLCVGLQLLAVLAIAWYWDTPYRLAVAAGGAALALVAGAACAFAFASALRAKPRPFDGSLLALAADVEALK